MKPGISMGLFERLPKTCHTHRYCIIRLTNSSWPKLLSFKHVYLILFYLIIFDIIYRPELPLQRQPAACQLSRLTQTCPFLDQTPVAGMCGNTSTVCATLFKS